MVKKKANNIKISKEKRAPVVAVMGHIDHGKSSLLDYIRKSNVVSTEAGGITQHISAYEAKHNERKITFIDTPGHEAFSASRSRGANIADIAILVVAADDGVKDQTKSALEFIKGSEIPFIVAINKIDKPESDVNRVKTMLLEEGVYLEGMGGDISYAEVSALTGKGIDDLLETVLLAADLEELEAEHGVGASGVVLESQVDPKRGISATLIIKNGDMRIGNYVQAGESATAPVRILENFAGKSIKEATFSMPVNIVGFDALPAAGNNFLSFKDKKELTNHQKNQNTQQEPEEKGGDIERSEQHNFIPLIIKTDVAGSLDAIKHQLKKIGHETADFKIIYEGVGYISDNDIKQAGGDSNTLVVGFNVGISRGTKDLADKFSITIKTFPIIYELTEFLEKELENRRPRVEREELQGEAKVIRIFSVDNKGSVVGGKVISGIIKEGDKLTVIRREIAIGNANIKELQHAKQSVSQIEEGQEFGMRLSTKLDLAEGDKLQAIKVIHE